MIRGNGGATRPTGSGDPTVAGTGPSGLPADDATPDTVHDLEEAVHQIEEEDRPPAAGVVTNVVVALAVIALGGAILFGSFALDLGNAAGPKAGTWPFLIGSLLVALGVALLPLARRTHDAEKFTRTSWLVLAGLATMVVFVALISVIGFEIPAALLTFVWLRFLGREGWRLSILTSIGVVAAFYLIFVVGLSVPIPHLF